MNTLSRAQALHLDLERLLLEAHHLHAPEIQLVVLRQLQLVDAILHQLRLRQPIFHREHQWRSRGLRNLTPAQTRASLQPQHTSPRAEALVVFGD